MTLLLDMENLAKSYRLPRDRLWQPSATIQAVSGVSLQVRTGINLGIVGESGSGKSTLARLIMALERPDSGSVRLLGQNLHDLKPPALRALRRQFQMVFQDPFGSLDPRHTVARIVAEPLARPALAEVAAILQAVAMHPSDAQKYPHEFSGGQRQRIAIARALITQPRLIVADEPVSALDVSVQAQVLNLMQDLQRDFGMTYVFISHDLAVVAHMCPEAAVMYRGRIVERGPTRAMFARSAHPYTQALVDSVAKLETKPKRRAHVAALPSGAKNGCAFAENCAFRQKLCLDQAPELRALDDGRSAACHFAEDRIAVAPAH